VQDAQDASKVGAGAGQPQPATSAGRVPAGVQQRTDSDGVDEAEIGEVRHQPSVGVTVGQGGTEEGTDVGGGGYVHFPADPNQGVAVCAECLHVHCQEPY